MKNITVSVDDETYKKARIAAARRETSVSALVKEFLSGITVEDEYVRLKRQEMEVRERTKGFSVSENASRDDLYRRDRS